MKTKLPTLILFLCCFMTIATQKVTAQSADYPNWISAYIGHNEYDGDFGNEMLQFDIPRDFGAGVGFSKYLDPSFDFYTSIYYGSLDKEGDKTQLNKRMILGNLGAKYNLSNGYLFKEESVLHPYIFAGVGMTYLYRGGKPAGEEAYFLLPLGIGADIKINDNVQVAYKSTYNRSFSDRPDGVVGVDANNHDDFLVHTIGLKFSIGGATDSDGDGVKNKDDECPDLVGEMATNGCPDRDSDGMKDSIDKCPDTAGNKEFAGCADSDFDRIPDYEDECPDVKGTSQFKGCPDSDNDMVADPIDSCPKVAGSKEMNGCPDSDSDGIIDSDDLCPEVAGNKNNKGCPDSDNDGIIDSEDACPDVAGTDEGNGCPVVSEEVLEEVNVIFSNLNFASNKSAIVSSSLPSLDRLAEIMTEDGGLILSIEGHTDSVGNDEYNLELSRERALAVKNYLIGKGVAPKRITSTGYGETQPLESNSTIDGRNRNRRVELNFSYKN